MTTYYTTASRVASLLQLTEADGTTRLTFDASSKPTLTEVETLINEVEDFIDSYTHRAWRTKTVINEYHDYEPLSYGRYRKVYTYYPIFLRHYKVQTFSAAQGDKLELWNGSTWTDIISSEGSGFYDGDFFVVSKELPELAGLKV